MGAAERIQGMVAGLDDPRREAHDEIVRLAALTSQRSSRAGTAAREAISRSFLPAEQGPEQGCPASLPRRLRPARAGYCRELYTG